MHRCADARIVEDDVTGIVIVFGLCIAGIDAVDGGPRGIRVVVRLEEAAFA